MAILKNVVLIGATGNVGAPVLKALLVDPALSVTVLLRPESVRQPAGVDGSNAKTVTVRFDDHTTLVRALRDAEADALVITVGYGGFHAQAQFIDAAVEAGVKRVVANEFGSDLNNPLTRQLAVFAPKIAARQKLEKLAGEGKITWTAISNGALFSWGLNAGFMGIKLKEKEAILYDGGNRPFSTSLLSDVAKGVVGILHHPEETENKLVYIHSTAISQKELVAACEKALGGGVQLETSEASTEEFEKTGNAKIARGDLSGFRDLLVRAVWGEGYGGDYTGRDSNELFGIKQLTKDEVEDAILAALV